MRDPVILALCGRAGAGKSTAALHLHEAHGFEPWAFAEPLRDMVEVLLSNCGIDYAWLHEHALKDQPLPHLGVSCRDLMRAIGDACNALKPGFFVAVTELALGLHDLPRSAPVHDRLLITDVRYPAEAEWVRRMGGRIVRIVRAAAPAVSDHGSEQHVDGIEAWQVIDNNGSRAGLHTQLDGMVEAFIEAMQAGEARP